MSERESEGGSERVNEEMEVSEGDTQPPGGSACYRSVVVCCTAV